MSGLHFDEARLATELRRLSPSSRAAFATACAERLRPQYEAFAHETSQDDPDMLAKILQALWDDLEAAPLGDAQLQSYLEHCLKLIPFPDDQPWVPQGSAAEGATAALAYALRCRLNGSIQEAAWAARCVYEAVDQFVITTENVDLSQAGIEMHLLSHPLVQAELSRQWEDLEDLRAVGATQTKETISRLKRRAIEQSKFVFRGASSR